MTSYLTLALAAVAISATISTARVIPAEPLSVMLDAYGNPVLFLREKRAPLRPVVPQRAMMFTGYYRPARRSEDGDQATGVFAQGNSVSGGSYLGGIPPTGLKNGPEPIDEPEVSRAQAEAAPEVANPNLGFRDDDQQVQDQPDAVYSPQKPSVFTGENDAASGGHLGTTTFSTSCKEQPETPIADPEPLPEDVEDGGAAVEIPENSAAPEEAGQAPAPEGSTVLAQRPPVKKGKKRPIVPEAEDEDEDDFEDEESVVPSWPVSGNRRQGGYVPNLNNFFPMMFSFPGVSRRAGSSGSLPGVVTAIANSYSTGKSGVASSIATAYGGAPNGKKARRTPVAEE
ncbi:uncharacterized protein LOC124405126 isoform X1 [Diprion similis]|uniref:uncharacterized protein LOC124405126 isoform X1 n=1 Tax=Diprion similis TaxID=362088 RepID=UPI001EF86D4E|nr:uncharacterized protein LOC124405126 isoform X1 [Diprion similis]